MSQKNAKAQCRNNDGGLPDAPVGRFMGGFLVNSILYLRLLVEGWEIGQKLHLRNSLCGVLPALAFPLLSLRDSVQALPRTVFEPQHSLHFKTLRSRRV